MADVLGLCYVVYLLRLSLFQINERSEYSYIGLADFFFMKKSLSLFTLNFDFSRLDL